MSVNTFSYLILLLLTMALILNGFNSVHIRVILDVYIPLLSQVIYNFFSSLNKINNKV
jgi:hypothetical protein